MGFRPQGPLGPQGPYGPQGISWKSMHFFFLNFFLCGKNLGFGPQGPQGPKGPHAFFIFILKINAFFFLGFFLCGNRHRARAQGAPGAPWASSNLTNRAGIRVKRHLQKPKISKIAYIIPQKMVFFQFSKWNYTIMLRLCPFWRNHVLFIKFTLYWWIFFGQQSIVFSRRRYYSG